MAALLAVLAWAVIRPRGWPEAAAVPAAVLVTATGAIPAHDALAEARRLGPVIGFLAAVLVLAQLCADEGRRYFAADLDAGARPERTGPGDEPGIPVFTPVVVAATLAGFVIASAAGVNPAWASRGIGLAITRYGGAVITNAANQVK